MEGMHVDGDIVDTGFNADVLGDGVTEEEGVCAEVGEDDGVVNKGDESSTTRSPRMVLTYSGVVWEGVG